MCTPDNLTIAAELRGLSEGIATYLKEYLSCRNGFDSRTFYGESFTLALLTQIGQLGPDMEEKLVRAYKNKDHGDPEFHWEFNHYGMTEADRLQPPLIFKNTRCTNWTLLRSNVRIAKSIDADDGTREAVDKIRKMQKISGFIIDDPGVRSFQYHCFSAAMIYEIYQKTKNELFLDSFLRAVFFIRHFILPNGDTLYVGRGQQQSFGYASLIYILCAFYAKTKDRSVLGDLFLVTKYLLQHARHDGSLPLVLGGGPEPLPHHDTPHRDRNYPGWYAYNNYFDYLPFAGLFLKKAADLLSDAPLNSPIFFKQESYRDSDFLKEVSGETVAVVARTGGYWTNDLPVPYVYSGGRVRTPCYGGEQFGNSIYSIRGIPLPVGGRNISMRRRAISFFVGKTLVVVSPIGILFRSYELNERKIILHQRIFSPFRLRDRFLFENNGPIIRSEYPLFDAGEEYSVKGLLRAYEAEHVGDITLEFPE